MKCDSIKVSIAIPIYNCENYIAQCAKSLFEQTHKNIEYIFVDDNSPDNSIEILQKIIKKYPEREGQINIIRLESNKGLAYSRKVAIENMNGSYCAFCDSDDWLENNFIELSLNEANRTDADILVSPFYINKPNKEYIDNNFKDSSFDLNNIPLNVLHFSLANKLFRSSIFKAHPDIRGLEGVNCWEDFGVMSRLFSLGYKVVIYNIPFYHYRKFNHHSLTSENHKNILRDHLIYGEYLDNWFKSMGTDFYSKYQPFLKFMKFTAKIKMLRGKEKDFEGWKKTFPETNIDIMKYKFIPLHYRIAFQFAKILPTPILNLGASISQLFLIKK